MKRTFLMIISVILVFALCACASQDAPAETVPATTEATTAPTEEPVPETTVPTEPTLYFSVTTTDTGAKLEADNLTATLDNNRLSVTLSGLTVADEYLTNASATPANMAEYYWAVKFIQGDHSFSLGTRSWAFDPGAEEMRSIEMFDHAFSRQEGNSWVVVTDSSQMSVFPEFSYTPDSITWTVTIPQQYVNMTFDEILAQREAGTNEYVYDDFLCDFTAFEEIQVSVQDHVSNHFESFTYYPAA